MGENTDFQLFLKQMATGHVYYDLGIKMEHCSAQPKIKNAVSSEYKWSL